MLMVVMGIGDVVLQAISVAEGINKNVHVNVKTSKTEETTPLKSTVAVDEEVCDSSLLAVLAL